MTLFIKAYASGGKALKANTAAGQNRVVNNMKAAGASQAEIDRAISNLRSNPNAKIGVTPTRQRGPRTTTGKQ